MKPTGYEVHTGRIRVLFGNQANGCDRAVDYVENLANKGADRDLLWVLIGYVDGLMAGARVTARQFSERLDEVASRRRSS